MLQAQLKICKVRTDNGYASMIVDLLVYVERVHLHLNSSIELEHIAVERSKSAQG